MGEGVSSLRRGKIRAGSNPAFGTILKLKGIPAVSGVPFSVQKCPMGKFYGSLE